MSFTSADLTNIMTLLGIVLMCLWFYALKLKEYGEVELRMKEVRYTYFFRGEIRKTHEI
jgi:hypothetical protein